MNELQQTKRVIIVGAGASISEGIDLGLWDKINGNIIWSCNYAWLTMPYLPTRELFVDRSFFKNNTDKLNDLANQGIEIVSKKNFITENLPKIVAYNTTRNIKDYNGKEGIKNDKIFTGQQGFCGTFALHIAICEGYNEIFLLGFDFGIPKDSVINITHYYQSKINVISSGMGKPHIYKDRNGNIHQGVNDYSVFAIEQNIKISNVSLISNIPFFDKISYSEFFEKINEI